MTDDTYSTQIGLELGMQDEVSLGVSYFSRPGGVVMKTTAEYYADKDRVSERNIIYVYTDYYTDNDGVAHSGIKIGDGKAYIVDLPFASGFSEITEESIRKIAQELKTKVSATIAIDDSENLVFYN